jgi:hypothetical protein
MKTYVIVSLACLLVHPVAFGADLDFSLRCTGYIDDVEHLTTAHFQHHDNSKVYVSLQRNGQDCSAFTKSSMTFPEKMYVVNSCKEAFFFVLRDSVWTLNHTNQPYSMDYNCEVF